jgi:penicillin-binding protein 1C
MKQKWWQILRKKRFALPIIFLCSFGVYDLLFPFRPQVNYAKMMLDRDGKILAAYQSEDDKWRFKVKLEELSPDLVQSFIKKEDKYFYYHWGVNPLAVLRALNANILKNKRVSGASTISMQVVRMLERKPRSYSSKISEAIKAFQLETHFSKKEILEHYLSLVPLGSNIEGVSAASYIYFQKSPLKLSLAQSVALSVIPNRPSLMNPSQKTRFEAYMTYWLNKYKKDGIFETTKINEAATERLIFKKHAFSSKAFHFTQKILNESTSQNSSIKTTLKLNWQLQIEQQLKQHVERLKAQGLQNGTVMVVDNRTLEVLVYCGSADPTNKLDAGQVDGIHAIRSPGSTLKPFLYGLGMELGLVNPKTVLYDIPSSFAGYSPVNFDNTYLGKINMAEALQLSLNIPAVKMLDEIKVKTFIKLLKKLNFENIKTNEEKLGLSLTLGGCGVNMGELVAAYASIANLGNYQTLKTTLVDKGETKKVSVLDSATCFILSQILSGVSRPDFPNNFEFTYKLPKIAWKTGTSYGKRDAWALGYNPNYTVGVWLGNFSGEGMPNISGVQVATPLLFQVFNTIEKQRPWFKMPSSLIYRQVCSVTGKPLSEDCSQSVIDFFGNKTAPKSKCTHFTKIWVNRAETMSYCPKCINHTDAKVLNYNYEPAAYQNYLYQKGQFSHRIPAHNASCQSISYKNHLQIISPQHKGLYYIENGKSEKITCEAEADPGTAWLYWYHNGKFLGKFNLNQSPFIQPTLGQNIVSCTNPYGKSSKVVFEVQEL